MVDNSNSKRLAPWKFHPLISVPALKDSLSQVALHYLVFLVRVGGLLGFLLFYPGDC
jgi:hypothetical protein